MQNDGADNETDADVYAREVSHRAANTLQTAIAALHLGLRGDQRLMRRAYDQLTAASELHLMLASGERVPVNIASRVTEVCMAVGRSLGAEGDIDLVLDAKPLMVCPEDARRISMLVSELVGNSIRHAFPTGRGAILVSLNSRGGQTIITVEDDGICGGWSRPGDKVPGSSTR